MKILGLIALFLGFGLIGCATHDLGSPQVVVAPEKKKAVSFVMTEKVFNFAPNSSELDNEDKQELQKIISDVLKNQKKYRRIEIIGHSDQTGTEDDNLDISKERALSILDAMKTSGIDRKMIRTSWLAGTEPLEEGAIESSLNRRVEIRLFLSKK